ncbi:MAG: discoidin domain-containing protein [Paludibacteraceae bacterium]|nr:discoidin domain-containing protein [Paludibacteraceae bacterium]
MKKHFLKSFALLAMLFSALTLSAQSGVDWSMYEFLGDGAGGGAYSNKYKVAKVDGMNVVNIQTGGVWGASIGIYTNFPAAGITCDLSDYSVDGAGMLMHLSSFTAKETKVNVTYATGSCTFWVYYADGIDGGSDTPATPTEILDVNFALTSNGSSAEATSGDATAAIDNNAGTRWESAQADPQTWILDLGQLRIFNTLEIVWEGAYGKTFTVSASDDKENWTPIWTVEGQALAGFPYTQTQKIDKTTARYIQFHGTERGTGYGYSFWEFRVYLAGESTFTSLEATPTTNLSKVGEGNAITLTPKDQNGKPMADVGEVTYTITPAGAGTITNNVYTPARIGLASIVATIGEVSAPAFEVFAYDGENVALSPDINNSKIIAQSEFAPSGTDAWHAIDGNEGSVWQGSATNGGAGDEAARTYDSWFIVDFGGYYDINLVTIQFEGACSQEYHVDFSADNATWNQAYNYVGAANVNPHTQLIYGADLQNTTKVRYARFYSTKAATQWGMKIFEFKVFGTPWVAPEDDVKPVMGMASLVSKNGNSVVIAVSATDNTNIKGYRVKEGTYNKIVLPNGEGNITVDNLEYGSHTLTITAIDEANNESDNNASVEFTLEVPEITDVNFALTTQGSSATASEGNAVEAIDDNMATRWGTGQSDPHWWVVDLGQLRIFNTIQIVWEGAYGKTFTIETSSDNSDWDLAATITDQELAGFPYTQTISIDKTTARYVRFNGTARGTQWGYSFWEFRVYLAGASILTSLAAQPASNLTKLGESNAITITPKDQNGTIMADAGEVVYTITPADAGTITNNIYTPAKVGIATIVAAIGEVKAEAFDVIAYEGENIALSTNMATDNKIYEQSSPSEGAANAFFAIDENDNGVWRGAPTEANTGADEASRTYDAWFVVDFGAYYDINLVTIKFENACSQKYHVDFSEDATTWNTTYNYEGNAGWNAHTACIAGSDLQNATKVRYARFYSTMAATEFGVQIYSFKVFGTPYVAAGDTEKPVMGTATLVSKTHKSAIIAVSATDNDEVGSYHVVCTNPAYEQTLIPTEGQITLTGLTAATAYNFTITAIDLAGNESENAATVECTTNIYNAKPTSAPTPPTHDAKQVKSVFSDVYGGTFSAMEGWGQATQFEELNFNGDYVRYYTNLNYLGWATGSPINASVMEKLHLDIWAAEDATIIIVPIYGGPGLVTDDQKTKTVTVKGQEWNSIDLTLATDFAGLNLSSIYQFKFDAPQGTDKFAIDNVYFYTTQVSSDVTPPANLTVTAVPSFTTAVINCQATDESGSISYEVYFGAELKGTGSADSGATASITVTNLQPNREFTMTVIATDVYGNKSPETVDVTFTTLAYPDPAPTPIWKAENVFSIYSDAYASQANRAFGWWGASTVEAVAELAIGDDALQYTTSTYLGWSLNNDNTIGDVSAYPYLHMDIYVENAGSIQFTPIWGAEALKTYTLDAGWNSIDIDLTAEFAGINLANIYQLKWAAMPATCFIDNVYFYRVVIDEDVDLTQLNNGMVYDVTLKRNFAMGDDGWNTISLPFALNAQQIEDIFGTGTKVTKLTSSNLISSTEIDLQFVEVTAMEAATPYLIHPTNNVDAGALVEDVVINVTPNIIEAGITQMIPVLKTENFTGKDNAFFLGPNDNLYNQSGDGKIMGLRAYFKFSTLTPAQLNNLRARVVFNENTETGVDNLITDEAPTKMIQNGQLVIIRNGIKYNVQGQKL